MSEDDKPRGKPVVKAKLPAAKNIGRSEFTPHGINSKRGGGYRPSGMTAAQAKKRRRLTAAGVLVVILAVAAGTTYMVTRPAPVIEASGAFGKEPKVEIPKKALPTGFKVSAPVVGKGHKLANGDSAYVKFIFFKWGKDGADKRGDKSVHEKLGSTYEQGGEATNMVVGKSGVKGIDKALLGKTAGSRLIMELPPADAFGKEGNPQLNVAPTDTLVFVMDVVGAVPKGAAVSGTEKKLSDPDLPEVTKPKKAGEAPKVTVPDADPPGKLESRVLIEGTGPVVAKGQTLVAHYEGRIWKGGKVFDSSWQRGEFATFPIGVGKVVKGWDNGLVGKKVGSRVLLVIPPGDGYGKEGNPQAGIKGTDTLVFVVDILGAMPA
ncbi:hypothetical protein DPM19_28255 [Actinomadura craniellae]|uniref:peptidylprolyl isomerase n=1 Tax=Actinomadura craniellae TaxID=2231787 RepID=A0A365GYL9_9ACTN|nr:FKBP-type peptidyl-prolyl cis-trans isomerase [Actinomadura craniellae]RAY11868.1 hypothetical protein DPM19_28255 [Actinomadura craniellae]